MTTGERIALGLIVTMIIVVPIGLGSVPGFDGAESDPGPWMAFFMALGPWHLFLFFGLALLVLAGPSALDGAANRPILFLFGFVALGLLQLVPLPDLLARVLAPTARAHREALDVGIGGISWLPDWTVREVARFGAYIGVLSAAAAGLRSRRARWIAAGAIVAIGSAEAVYGLLERFALDNRILGFAKLTGIDEVTGTFINRNHLAALLEIAVPLALGILVFRRRVPGRDGEPRRVGPLDIALGLAAIAMIAAVALTLSRAAFGALFVGLLVFLYATYGRRAGKSSRATLVVFLVLLVVVPVLLVASVGGLERRFSYGVSDEGLFDIRFPAWQSTLALAGDQPVLGTGLGSYREAIHAYQSPQVAGELFYAHNDYLNLLADGGLVGLLLGLGFGLACLRPAWRRAGGPEGQSRTLGIAAVAAVAAVGAHSVFEFNLQIPGVTVPLLVLAGLGMTTSRRAAPTPEPGRDLRGTLTRIGLLVIVGAAMAFWSADELRRARARGLLAEGSPGDVMALFEGRKDSLLEGNAWFALGEMQLRDGMDPTRQFEMARRRLESAASEVPLRAAPWYALGLVDLAEKSFDDAHAHFRAARRFSRGRGEMNYRIGATLVLLGLQKKDDAMLGEGADALREAGTIDPGLFSKAFDAVGPFIRDLEILRRMTPDTVYGRLHLVGLLMRLGRLDQAVEEQRALERIEPTAESAFRLGEILIRGRRYDEAAVAMERYLERAGVRERTLDAVYRQYVLGRRRGPARDLMLRIVEGPGRGVAHAHYLLALVCSDLGRHEEALAAIRRAMELGGRQERYLKKHRAILSDIGARGD